MPQETQNLVLHTMVLQISKAGSHWFQLWGAQGTPANLISTQTLREQVTDPECLWKMALYKLPSNTFSFLFMFWFCHLSLPIFSSLVPTVTFCQYLLGTILYLLPLPWFSKLLPLSVCLTALLLSPVVWACDYLQQVPTFLAHCWPDSREHRTSISSAWSYKCRGNSAALGWSTHSIAQGWQEPAGLGACSTLQRTSLLTHPQGLRSGPSLGKSSSGQQKACPRPLWAP